MASSGRNLPDYAGVYADFGNSPLNSRSGRGSLRESGILMHNLPTRTLEFRDFQKSASKPFPGELRRIYASALNSRDIREFAVLVMIRNRTPTSVLVIFTRSYSPGHIPFSCWDARYPATNLNTPKIFQFRPPAARFLENKLRISRQTPSDGLL